MSNVRVLIADDSAFMRLLTAEILKNAGGFDIIEFASNGKQAVEKVCSLKPDVVIMDLIMGDYDGVYGVENIMKNCPTPIVMLSSMGHTDMEPIMKALKAGAVDYHNKPDRSKSNVGELDKEFVLKVKTAAQAELAAAALNAVTDRKTNVKEHTFSGKLNYDVIVIGSSTGGPTAVETIISRLPGNLAVPVLIAQHMPSNFVPSFANRLDQITPLNVVMAKKDDVIVPGTIFIAPGSRNMVVRRDVCGKVIVDFTSQRFKEFNFPSVNGLMHSVAEVYGKRAIGIILTGMGKDGTDGLRSISEAGGYTLAQSKDTCVVYGMPKEAFESGAAKRTVPLNEIGPFVVSCLE